MAARLLVSAATFALGLQSVRSEVVHYPPRASNINNITFVLSGSGAPGIYNSSSTPNGEYGVYNWCNMPHVRVAEYKVPPKNYTLEYVEVIQRHHKRTPYASNTFTKEDIPWSCEGSGPVYGIRSASGGNAHIAGVQWQASVNPNNPWSSQANPGFVNSTCQFPQITDQGLEDSITHGKDLRKVYADRLGLGSRYSSSKAQIRVTTNVITSQVASGLVKGLFPDSDGVEVQVQSSSYDSLEPTYSCPKANSLKTAVTTGSQAWNDHLAKAAGVYAQLDAVSGIPTQDNGGWHVSFDHYYDNLSAKQCHAKPLPCNLIGRSACVSQDLANTVYRLGNWEYSWQWRDAPESALYATLKYGVWILELQGHLQAVIAGQSKFKYFHNVAHDGSVSPVLGFLQAAKMVWPGMGSEIVFELYSSKQKGKKSWFLRVLWGGQPLETSTPLGVLDMIPVNDFFTYVSSTVGTAQDLYTACNSS